MPRHRHPQSCAIVTSRRQGAASTCMKAVEPAAGFNRHMPLTGEYAPSTSDWARTQAERYEATDGAEGGELRGMPVIVLTTIGAKSGMLRKTALMR
ncbi:nitroreductase/quinone reductase family protein, partial [Salinibacterium sp.]|uniref:nitroreductase/quinone reductase family protein n=1 Tax=Salinibacterium sp. TaxID=1915057 RepID=UPI00286C70CA